MSIMPQEIEVWYIIPTIRKELAKSIVSDFKLTQKEAARKLEITEAAVSQYLKSKRAKKVALSSKILKEIKRSASRIIKENNVLMKEMRKLCTLDIIRNEICKIHHKECESLPNKCKACRK